MLLLDKKVMLIFYPWLCIFVFLFVHIYLQRRFMFSLFKFHSSASVYQCASAFKNLLKEGVTHEISVLSASICSNVCNSRNVSRSSLLTCKVTCLDCNGQVWNDYLGVDIPGTCVSWKWSNGKKLSGDEQSNEIDGISSNQKINPMEQQQLLSTNVRGKIQGNAKFSSYRKHPQKLRTEQTTWSRYYFSLVSL